MNAENKWDAKILILFTYFSVGAFALISQTTILREFFVVVYGNEFIFGILLTNWLVGIFTGALTGSAVAEKSKNNLLLFVFSILAMGILLPLSITLIRFLYSISGTTAGTYISFFKVFLYSACFIIPIGFFIGFAFPTAAKVQLKEKENDSSKTEKVKKISNIYIFEAFGALLGGIVYTFFLVGQFNAYFIAALFILPMLVCAGILLLKSKHYKTFSISCLLLILNLVLLLPPVNSRFEIFTVEKRWGSVSTLPLTYSIDSRFQNISVANLFGQHNLYLNTMFASAFPNDDDNMLLAAQLVCQHPSPQRILIIGDAVSGLAKFLLRFNVKEVTSVEIDPKTVDTILKFLPAEDKKILNDRRFKIIIKDGRKYVKDIIDSETPAFDIVYVNAAEPSTLLLNRYYTAEFFFDLSRVLRNNGVIALKITSSENYGKGVISDYTAAVFHTVRSVFPEVVVTPGTYNFIFASRDKTSISDNPDLLARRYEQTGMEPRELGMIFHSIFPEEKTSFIKKTLQDREKSSINTDETPIACLYFNKITGWYGQGNLSGILGFFEKVKLSTVIFIILVLFLFRLLYVFISAHRNPSNPSANSRVLRFHTLLAVFSSGMAGLSLELVILYSFQNNFGNVYHIIGFIIAVFMFGLPIGAVVSNVLITKKRFARETQIIKFIIFIQMVTAGFSFLLPHVVKLFVKTAIVNQIIIFSGTMLIGAVVGMVFPLSIHIYLGKQEKTGKTAGIVDAFDHMGAAVGAFFIGTLLLPVIGIAKVCTLVAIFPLIASFLLFTDILPPHAKASDKAK